MTKPATPNARCRTLCAPTPRRCRKAWRPSDVRPRRVDRVSRHAGDEAQHADDRQPGAHDQGRALDRHVLGARCHHPASLHVSLIDVRAGGLPISAPVITPLCQDRRIGASCVEHRGVLDGRRHRLVAAVGDAAHASCAGSCPTGSSATRAPRRPAWNAATAPISSRTSCTSSSASPSVDAPALSTTSPRGTWPLISSAHADHRALGHRRVGGQHLLDGAGRQAVPGNVDDVVDAAHHEQVAVLVEVAAVAGQVVAGMLGQVRRLVAVVGVPQRRQGARAAAAAGCRSRPPRRRRIRAVRRAGCARRNPASARSASPA